MRRYLSETAILIRSLLALVHHNTYMWANGLFTTRVWMPYLIFITPRFTDGFYLVICYDTGCINNCMEAKHIREDRAASALEKHTTLYIRGDDICVYCIPTLLISLSA